MISWANPHIFDELNAERRRAHRKHGLTSAEIQPWDSHRRMSILTEEIGEVAAALNDLEHGAPGVARSIRIVQTRDELRAELIQAGAMILSWIAAIDNPHTR